VSVGIFWFDQVLLTMIYGEAYKKRILPDLTNFLALNVKIEKMKIGGLLFRLKLIFIWSTIIILRKNRENYKENLFYPIGPRQVDCSFSTSTTSLARDKLQQGWFDNGF
jgi:hypothetical protein